MATSPVVLEFVKSKCSKSGHDVEGVPSQYGIYYVATKTPDSNEILPLYIGMSDDLNHRLSNHEKYDSFIKNTKNNEELVIYTAVIDAQKVNRIEQAMIYHFKPPLNDKHKNSFDNQDTTITLVGHIKYNQFTVNKTV
ncbi:GIY-YIG nuclease family protein [Providencia rettgeri]|uniref:GIY-YIG nuclease family protein n=1 Tax=Providencia rettgeri TaxID=587 RepID=UPI001B375A1F|nr:GIY-YIG nuclease family protein [Providencia rettgeri]MBQ0367863.1 GIY-YIG nuclease family protein [Providencia rettgeri]